MQNAIRITIGRIRYHRNGVGGEGFHTISFDEGRGQRRKNLRAVLFDGPGQCAVVDQNDAGARFCGDYYEATLRAAVAEQPDDPLRYHNG